MRHIRPNNAGPISVDVNRPIDAHLDATSSLPSTPSRRMIGMNCNPSYPVHLDAIGKLGVKRVRSTLYWTNWPDGAPGEIIDAARSKNLDLLMVVHMPPDKYKNDRVNGTPALAALLADRAAAWPGLSWQIMNEMDGNDGFNGGWFQASDTAVTQRQRGEWYGPVLEACGKAIRAADPSAKVAGGGMALEPADFVRGILATCDRASYDALAVHAYGQPDIGQFSSKAKSVHDVDPNMPLWCTEFGSRLSDEAAQSAELAEVFTDNDVNTRYERVYLYALEDQTEGYGIMAPDGSFRAAASLITGRMAV